MKIYIGADHRGFALKDKIEAYLAKRNYPVEDVGALQYDKDDDATKFAALAAVAVIGSDDKDPRAILICRTGQIMAMAANRFNGIRAAVPSTPEIAKLTRIDNNSNVLCLAAELFDSSDDWQPIVDVWLGTKASRKARYVRRNEQLDRLS
jgi:ribose 5-phosphate isomerase B